MLLLSSDKDKERALATRELGIGQAAMAAPTERSQVSSRTKDEGRYRDFTDTLRDIDIQILYEGRYRGLGTIIGKS